MSTTGAARFVDLLDRKVPEDMFYAPDVRRLVEGEDLADAPAPGRLERVVRLAHQVVLVEGVGGNDATPMQTDIRSVRDSLFRAAGAAGTAG